jgi:hypothetical protein
MDRKTTGFANLTADTEGAKLGVHHIYHPLLLN